MKEKIIRGFCLLLALFSAVGDSYAQQLISDRPNITLKELYTEINSLIVDMNEENQARLNMEAKALAASDNEQWIALAAMLYERTLGQPELAVQTRQLLFDRFPSGSTARMYALTAIFQDKDADIAWVEQQYKIWLEKFPPQNFSQEDQYLYIVSQMYFAERYAQKGMLDKLRQSMVKTKDSDFYLETVLKAYAVLNVDYRPDFFGELEEAYNRGLKLIDLDQRKAINSRLFTELSMPYAEILTEKKMYDRALLVLQHPLVASSVDYNVVLDRTILLGAIYSTIDREDEATAVYESFLTTQGTEEHIVREVKRLYVQKQETDTGFQAYLNKLVEANDIALYAKYKEELVKAKAPDFTLLDTEGRLVSLSDYRGKTVVLDFWATWCIPCIQSFPGMQAAVNKYADDENVIFLFIDTWQRETNYKEVVKKFLTDRGYQFHVLFDEMKEAPKSVATAFGLKGIPTKVIIDQEGYIRFNSSGSEVNIEKLVKELDIKIELAKSK